MIDSMHPNIYMAWQKNTPFTLIPTSSDEIERGISTQRNMLPIRTETP